MIGIVLSNVFIIALDTEPAFGIRSLTLSRNLLLFFLQGAIAVVIAVVNALFFL